MYPYSPFKLALFIPRQKITSEEDTQLLAEEWAEDLESMKCFVLEGKKFVHLPEEEKGQFHSANCYVFVCRYLYAPELDDDEEVDDDDDAEDEEEVIVYFWEGRHANQLGWLTFTFTLQKNLEKMFQDKLRIIRMKQQQEDEKFLSHFDGRFLILQGRRFTKSEREAITNRQPIKVCNQVRPFINPSSIFTTAECNIFYVSDERSQGAAASPDTYSWLNIYNADSSGAMRFQLSELRIMSYLNCSIFWRWYRDGIWLDWKVL